MSCHAVNRWLFGKLPAQGDFVSRGLDADARDRIDRWLSAELESARAAFPDFDARYDAAPPWHFVDHAEDGSWAGGALCASVDRAGRRFPLMLATPAADAADAARASAGCLDSLYAALAEGWDADALHEAEIPRIETFWHPAGTQWALLGEDAAAYTLSGRNPGGILTVMLELAW